MKVCKLRAHNSDRRRFGTCLSFFDQNTKTIVVVFSDLAKEKVIAGFNFSQQLGVWGHFDLQSYHAKFGSEHIRSQPLK